MEEEETVRLVMPDGSDEEKKSEKVCQGAANVMVQWPKLISSACSLIVVMALFVILFAFAIYVHTNSQALDDDQDDEEEEEDWNSQPTGIVISRMRKKILSPFEFSNDVFFIRTEALEKESACCIESALKMCPDKNVYVMFLSNANNGHHERRLRETYPNLNVIRTEGSKYLKGSVFSGKWDGEEKSLFAAQVLTEWEFGGAVISDGLLMYTRKLFDPEGFCKVHPQVFYCPKQCAAFVYDLMNATERAMGNEAEGVSDIVGDALIKFCGSTKYLKSGCEGGTRLESSTICDNPQDDCAFIKLADFKRNNVGWESRLPMFCPEIMKEESRRV